jgi:uncharacterized protein (DUF1778 family)
MEEVTFDLSNETIVKLALMAHEQDMKLNDFIVNILTDYAKELIKDSEKLEFLVESK